MGGSKETFLKIEDIIACLYSDENTPVQGREVKINDVGEREDNCRKKSLSCGNSTR